MQEIPSWCAFLLTILPGIVIAARLGARWNVVVVVINGLRIYRWLIWNGNA